MKATITIYINNASVGECGYGPELARILRKVASQVKCNRDDVVERELTDAAGNHVGNYIIN